MKLPKKYYWSNFPKINIPQIPGVYFFENENKIIYIGKSVNIKNRLKSYRKSPLLPKTNLMISQTKYFRFIRLNNEYQALILESQMIKKYQPKYNIEEKDDKSYLYIHITDDKLPLIKFIREKQIGDLLNIKYIYGPFLDSKEIIKLLKSIRRYYPFSTHNVGKRVCNYNQMGLCDPCPTYINQQNQKNQKILIKEYKNNIKCIKNILSGKPDKLIINLKKLISKYSLEENYEKAGENHKKLLFLQKLSQNQTRKNIDLKSVNFNSDIKKFELAKTLSFIQKYVNTKNIFYIECYDISHSYGQYLSASLVSYKNGIRYTPGFRLFNIHQTNSFSDTDSMFELGQRRRQHLSDWGKPDLILLDGGFGQISSFKKGLEQKNILVVGIEKESNSFVLPYEAPTSLPSRYLVKGNKNKNNYIRVRINNRIVRNFISRIRDDAHHFANKHRKQKMKKDYSRQTSHSK